MKKKIILFDGICNLCNTTVQFIIENDPKNHFMFASLQSNYGQKFLLENNLNTSNFDSIILIDENKMYQKSDAAIRIAKQLKIPYNLISVSRIIPKKIRDYIYTYIAKNRYKWFGKHESCWVPTKELQAKFLS